MQLAFIEKEDIIEEQMIDVKKLLLGFRNYLNK
jgi:hypothetical protein